MLNCLQTGALCSTLAGTDESIVLCSAFNDYLIDQWLPVDNRLKFAMSVPSQDPQASAAEIRRLGKHPQIVAVSLPLRFIESSPVAGSNCTTPLPSVCPDSCW